MKPYIILAFVFFALRVWAQSVDSTSVIATKYFAEAKTAARNQQIWKGSLYGATMFVDPQTRSAWANEPDKSHLLVQHGNVYSGILPKNVMIANTAIEWQGKQWSVILWPLPGDEDYKLNLILHESFHRVQERLGFPAHSSTVDHLSTMQGRIYFLLELQALKAALLKPINQRQTDLQNALLFRRKRAELFPATFANERLLEMNEGLAEYTGVILGRPHKTIVKHLAEEIDGAGQKPSLIRSAAYLTGPVYGYLLYQHDLRWTMKIDSNADFPVLLATAYHLRKNNINGDWSSVTNRYNGSEIIKSEEAKEREHRRRLNHYQELFTREPVLTINLVKMNINFNPNNLFDLGAAGTVYPNAEVKDTWGNVKVDSVGMLMKNWQIIYLPASLIRESGAEIKGEGWTLNLNAGWTLLKQDELHYTLTKEQ